MVGALDSRSQMSQTPTPLTLNHRRAIWEFPKIRGTLLGVPIIRTIVFLGLYWGPLILGNYHIHNSHKQQQSRGKLEI